MTANLSSLEGKVALVTGAGTGIGRGIALLFAAQGAKVVITGRRPEPLQAVCALRPDDISAVQMNLIDAESRANAISTVIDRHGRLDILVNNAAYQLLRPFMDTSDEVIDELFYTNTLSAFRLIKAAVPHLAKTRGAIVNISSTAGRYIAVPSQCMAIYGASKAAMNHFTRTLAPELGPMGVRINTVAPGATSSEYSDRLTAQMLGSAAASEQAHRSLHSSTSLGRKGEPDDIAKTVLFLASGQADWVTGQVIDASGGFQIAAG